MKPVLVGLTVHVDQIGDVDHSDLSSDRKDPLLPRVIESRIVGHRRQSLIVPQSISTNRFKLIQEETLRSWLLSPIFGFATQDFQPDAKIEAAPLVFSLQHDICLKWREIMGQQKHGRTKHALMTQFSPQKVDSQG